MNSTSNRIIKSTTTLVAAYLILSYATGSGKLIFEATRGYGRVVEALQGRSNITTGN